MKQIELSDNLLATLKKHETKHHTIQSILNYPNLGSMRGFLATVNREEITLSEEEKVEIEKNLLEEFASGDIIIRSSLHDFFNLEAKRKEGFLDKVKIMGHFSGLPISGKTSQKFVLGS